MNLLPNALRRVRGAVLVALLMLAGAVTAAMGQAGWLQIVSPTGAELIQVLLNGSAVQNYVNLNQVRNSTGYQLSATATGTVTTTLGTDNLILTGSVTTLTVNLPPSPEDGQLFSLNNGTSSNFTGTITVATTDGSTIANGATAVNLGSAGSQEWQFTIGSKVWYRLR